MNCNYSFFLSISTVLKAYGQHLKAPAAMVRLRLYETLSLLPPNACEGSYTHLLRMLVAEFTLAENPGNTTTSLLRTLCHADDSVILGAWLHDTDHHTIEDQVNFFSPVIGSFFEKKINLNKFDEWS